MADKQITPFQLTDQFTMDNFNQRINETNIALQKMVNPNLLDNWYFANPVNQRGQTSYTGAGYGIDRWIQDGSITTLLTNDGLQITNSSDVALGISQIFETNYSGKTLTASILAEPGTLVVVWCNLNQIAVIQADSGGLATISFVAPTNDTSKVSLSVGKGTFLFKAAKLELGSQQTLAHQENGVWVLNEIPDYGEQLRRCQRYFQRIVVPVATSFSPVKDNSITYQCNLPVQMRAEPSVTCGTFFMVNRNNDSAVFSENFVTPIKKSASVNSVIISIEKTQSNPVTVGRAGGVYVGSYYDNPGTRIIDCTADL